MRHVKITHSEYIVSHPSCDAAAKKIPRSNNKYKAIVSLCHYNSLF